ncbi:RNA polymerase sigma-70 factor, ECF subfamily [Natronincola peptidivorans]|uniref:RNA polymerase sigma-70 factor, ECF subfamily n=1 Tax=Natronincola peptidivorans TaxID=426128 RepID=A0A1I0GIH4_9FIRM|nr:sigma-70 family RNA polymerase sigma factor [Natronincola peptidivorans]SET70718.1 RNA polymerase sigma-70 factor, ECF subfamily [Natronincola peptidivorans]
MEEKKDLESIYRYYFNDIYQYLFYLSRHPQIAEDLTQETFYRAYLYLESYKGEKVKPWLLRVAKNAFIDWYRKEKRHVSLEPTVLESIPNKEQRGPEEVYLLAEKIEGWVERVKDLPPKQQQVLLLCDYYDFTYQEIADVLHLTLADVKTSLFRGRKKVKELMEGGD